MEHNRSKWNDETIESEIRLLVTDLGGIFPSCAEMRARGRNDLACAITKRGGSIFWASKLNLQRAHSDSDFGWQGEDAFVQLCTVHRLEAHRVSGVKSPWDIEIEGILRIDVKCANLATYGTAAGWYYRNGKRPQADVVILYQADTGDFYGVPWWLCTSSSMTITRSGGKYAELLNNWPLIRQMLGLRMAERARLSHVAVADVA